MNKKINSKQEEIRKRVYEFYLNYKNAGKKFNYDHFKVENIPKSTIYKVIKRAESESGYQRVQGSGVKAKKMTRTNIERLKLMFDHKDGVSQRQGAKKFNCTQQHICKTLKKRTNIKSRKKMTIPKRSDQQKAAARTKCSRLCQKFKNRKPIIDDESYFALNHSSINGNDIFYTSDVKSTPSTVKYQTKQKFQKKLLLWITFSENGISQPYFVPSGLAVNQKIYLNK